MQIRVTVPSMLQHCTGGNRHVTVEATTLPELLSAVQREFPLVTPHVWDEQGNRRKHVMIFLNEQSIDWLPSRDVQLKAGDELQIVQAVSGG